MPRRTNSSPSSAARVTAATPSRVATLSRAMRRHRRALAAVLAACAVYAAVTELRPAAAAHESVLVAARDLPAGAALTADDVAVSSLPATWPGALSEPSAAIGRTLAVALPARAPVTSSSLVLPESLGSRARNASRVVMAVRLSDPGTAALLHAGDVVDVWAAGADALSSNTAAARVAAAAHVLAVPVSSTSVGPLTAGASGGLVVLAVDSGSVAALARAVASARLTVSVLPD